jgi:hypothetical protein
MLMLHYSIDSRFYHRFMPDFKKYRVRVKAVDIVGDLEVMYELTASRKNFILFFTEVFGDTKEAEQFTDTAEEV